MNTAADEVEIRDILLHIFNKKYQILATSLLVSVLVIAFSLTMPNVYRSDAVLAPVASGQQGGLLSSLANRFGALAGIAGIDIGSSSSDIAVTLQVMKSRDFLAGFVKEHELSVPIFAAISWDPSEKSWVIDPDVYDSNKKVWTRNVKAPMTPQPSDLEIQKKFLDDFLTVEQDKESGLILVSVSTYSPEMSQIWLDLLIRDINEFLREKAVIQKEKYVKYLAEELGKTAISELRQVFYELIQQQQAELMLAKVKVDYAFETVDKASLPIKKESPQRALMAVLSFMISAIFSSLFFVRKSIW